MSTIFFSVFFVAFVAVCHFVKNEWKKTSYFCYSIWIFSSNFICTDFQFSVIISKKYASKQSFLAALLLRIFPNFMWHSLHHDRNGNGNGRRFFQKRRYVHDKIVCYALYVLCLAVIFKTSRQRACVYVCNPVLKVQQSRPLYILLLVAVVFPLLYDQCTVQ